MLLGVNFNKTQHNTLDHGESRDSQVLTGGRARTECAVSASDLGLATEVGQAGEGGSREAALDDARMHGDGFTDSGGDGKRQRAGVVCEEVARRRAGAAVACAVRVAFHRCLRREPSKERRCGFVERTGHLGYEDSHLTLVGECISVLPVMWRDVAGAGAVV